VVTEEQVLDALRNVIDPDFGRDIVSLGFIKNLVVNGGEVSFTVELTTPACPVRERFKTQCEEFVSALPGVQSVKVAMSAQQRQAPHAQAEIDTLAEVNAIIAVSSCKGGVGKSTVAALLARAMSLEGLSVGLLDADLYGPSAPTLLGARDADVFMSGDILLPVEALGMKTMSFGYLIGESPAVMRGPMVSGYIQQLLTKTAWGKLDYLVIDMPPGTGDIQLTITQRAKLSGAVIVTTPQALSLADVAKGIVMFEKVEVPVLGLVENMSYFTCDGCGKQHRLFGSGTRDLKERFGLSTLAEIPLIPGISNAEMVAKDEAIEPIRELARNVHREIGKRRIEADLKPIATAKPGFIHIRWIDGTESELPNFKVRAACSCARCVDEYSGKQLLDINTIAPDIEAQEIQPLGNYALNIVWSDGHSSGIYSWDYLKRLA
jgi:Mrp family chromosome partitioning ATPase/DUF971 family protein